MLKKPADASWAKVTFGGSTGAIVQTIFTSDDSMEDICLKRYELEPNSRIEYHSHPWDHIFYGLEGSGLVYEKASKLNEDMPKQHVLNAGTALYLPGAIYHSILNVSLLKKFSFLSIIPLEWTDEEHRIEVEEP